MDSETQVKQDIYPCPPAGPPVHLSAQLDTMDENNILPAFVQFEIIIWSVLSDHK